MPLSVRLDEKTLRALRAQARKAGVSVSDLVRDAVKAKLESAPTRPAKTPFEHWQSIFGGYDSGETDRSQRVRELVGEAIRTKHTRRSRPE